MCSGYTVDTVEPLTDPASIVLRPPGMKVSVTYLPGSSGPITLDMSPVSRAVLRLPPSVFAAVYGQLCDGLLTVQAVRLSIRPGSSADPYLSSSSSSTPLLANLTNVQLGTLCNGSLVIVSKQPTGRRRMSADLDHCDVAYS